jgi:flagellar hook-associated protein 1 FlgK
MSSAFGGLEIARSALRTSQTALNVIGHNVANVNTPGYSRQVTHIAPKDPYGVPLPFNQAPGQVGTGVDVMAIQAVRDQFLEAQLQRAAAEQGSLARLGSLLDRVQAAFGEPGAGATTAAMTSFFNAWHNLAKNPEQEDMRAVIRQQGRDLAAQFAGVYRALTSIGDEITAQVRTKVDEANGLARQIARLNLDIRQSLVLGDRPNDLIDRRQELIKQLAGLVGARAEAELDTQGKPTGFVNVLVGGNALVSGGEALALPSDFHYNGKEAFLVGGAEHVLVPGGEVAGLIEGSYRVAQYAAGVDRTAAALIERVNAQHKAGYGLDGIGGRPFFRGTGAADIAVSLEVEASLDAIAASSPPVPPNPVARGNGDNARGIADILNERILNGSTLTQYYTAQVTQVGADAAWVSQRSQDLQASVAQLTTLRHSVSGVSLDEELSMMIQYQRSYQAAARFMATLDNLLNSLMAAFG